MPLFGGIRAFDEDNVMTLKDEVIIGLYDKRDAFLSVLRNSPELLEEPYPYTPPWKRTDGNSAYVCPASLPVDNPIYQAIVDADLLHFGKSALEADGEWQLIAVAVGKEGKIDARTYGEAYALIDAALYVTFLVNIYQPNRSIIQNFLAVYAQEDALGRQNLNAVQKAVEKVVKKSIGKADHIFADDFARNIITIAMHEATQNSNTRSARRGIDFEQDCARLLDAGGFTVRTTPASGDYGADLIAEKDDLRYAIQCKDTSKPVGVKAVQEAIGARRHYSVDYAVVCASAGFTEAAIELASSNKVVLCSANQLVRRLDAI